MTELIKKIIKENSLKTVIFLPKTLKQKVMEIIKYAQIGKISSGLIHDLSSPITALNIQFEIMDSKLIKKEDFYNSTKESFLLLEACSVLMKKYVSGGNTKIWIDAGDEIQKTIKLISYSAIKNNVQIQFIRTEGIKLFINPMFLYQISMNLILNAIESFREEDTNRKIIIRLSKIDKYTELTVQDFGCGIENTKRIFSFLYSTKLEKGGAGIGLSSIKYIIKKELKGKIEVYSKPNEGSIFKVLIRD